jgi:hypothetical protein
VYVCSFTNFQEDGGERERKKDTRKPKYRSFVEELKKKFKKEEEEEEEEGSIKKKDKWMNLPARVIHRYSLDLDQPQDWDHHET